MPLLRGACRNEELCVAVVEKARRGNLPSAWLARLPSPGDVAAWVVSLSVHMVALVVLASLTLFVPIRDSLLLSALPLEELDEELVSQEFHFSSDMHEKVGMLGDTGLDEARPSAPVEAAESEIAYELEPTTAIGEIEVHEFHRTILETPNVPDNVIIKGAGSVGTSAAMGAVDRITHEILLSLDERPTLVVWLFDRSGSLKPQRESIAGRFDRIYEELGVIESSGNEAFERRETPLLTVVAQFGTTIEMLTPKPTDERTKIKAAVRAVQDDDSGTENVFQSVGYLAEKFRHQRLSKPRRNVMIVVFTDEAGDDIEALDATVDVCRKYEMPVYVIGVPAPFGRETAYVKYVDPDPKFDQSPQWAPVRQGPESLVPERIKLLFGGREELEDQMDSGFGPFGLCRLSYETGGLYFTVHPNRETGKRLHPWETAAMSSHLSSFFDARVMRNYRPAYVPAQQYFEFVQGNAACAALVEASRLSAVTPMENVRLRFPRVDDAQFARDLSNAQRTAAKLEPKIAALAAVLRQGEAGRNAVTTPRWQAGFDLAIGRALAVKVRTEGYNAMLAEAKQGLRFKNEQSDTWVLHPAAAITTGSALTNDAADARSYLERVIADHPETPWAVDAERELRQPLGWEWREEFTDVVGRLARAEAARNRPPPERPDPPQKPRRDPPNL
jgi:von Willebrand factor type A domain